MWRRGRPTRLTDEERLRFVIAPHHPDRLRRPAAAMGVLCEEAFQQVLAWNVFRTLELVSPSFWLRRFHLRLTGEPSVVASQIARVHLWQRLPLPPIQRIDGERAATQRRDQLLMQRPDDLRIGHAVGIERSVPRGQRLTRLLDLREQRVEALLRRRECSVGRDLEGVGQGHGEES